MFCDTTCTILTYPKVTGNPQLILTSPSGAGTFLMMMAEGRDKQAPSLDSDRRNKMNPAEKGTKPNAYDTTVIPEKQKTPFPSWKKGFSWAHLESNQGPTDYESVALTD